MKALSDVTHLAKKDPVEVWREVHVLPQGKSSNVTSEIRIRLVRNLLREFCCACWQEHEGVLADTTRRTIR